MVEGLVNLSEIKQKLTNFDEALKLILRLKKNIKIKSENINLKKRYKPYIRKRFNKFV